MEIFGYVIGGDFYKVDSPSLSNEMKQKATPVVKLHDVENVIKSVCPRCTSDDWDGIGQHRRCNRCGERWESVL